MRHLNISVYGRVQGVFFRASTKTMAESLDLTGWCKNKSDGSVYIEVEGAEEQVEQFEAWCHRGPDFAKVESVVIEEGPVEAYAKFEIKRF